ncbi:uncharacterized protein LOC118761055 [Octopus sinensis]|uniref:Uncharacterized protein LOC118761055 n=1 Tax=Octopus sinensis TaxID=2607531 RepID=A0A7E6EH64_9MOLL|nr:uncharacterized protein LOC118761055 [Octopus sinensis]
MNLKGMETSMQFSLILISLPALSLVFFATPRTGASELTKVIFGELTASKCLLSRIKTIENTSSAEDCTLRCICYDPCEYVSYCNGSCYMHRSLYDKEIKDYDCNCSSYILLSGNGTGTSWQKVFEMTKYSFKRSPIYLYWDKLPIEKVKFHLIKKDHERAFIFNGTGTNSTSWFQKDKVLINPQTEWVLRTLTFNENFSHPYFYIETTVLFRLEAKRESGSDETYDISLKGGSTVFDTFEALVISVLFY